MESARESLKSIAGQAALMWEWNDAQLTAVRDRLFLIDRSMPSFGDLACKHCTQRLHMSTHVVTLNGGNVHCGRNEKGRHEPQLVT